MSLTVPVIPAPLAVSPVAPEPAAAKASGHSDFATLLAQWNPTPGEESAVPFTAGQLDMDALEQALLAAASFLPADSDADMEVQEEDSAADVVEQMLAAMQQFDIHAAAVPQTNLGSASENSADTAHAAADSEQHAALAELMSMLQLGGDIRPVRGAPRADSNESISLISPRARVRAAAQPELNPLRPVVANGPLEPAPAAVDAKAATTLPLTQAIEVASAEAPMPQLQAGAVSEQPRALQSFTLNAPTNEAAQPTPLLRLNEPLATSAWRGEFNQQVAQLTLKQGDQRVLMQLNPADLGPLTVELRVRDGQADLQFLSPHLQVRSAVSEALPQLREALSQQGISLGQADVSEQQHGQQWQQEREPASNGGFSLSNTAIAAEATATTTAKPAVTLAGRVNLYV